MALQHQETRPRQTRISKSLHRDNWTFNSEEFQHLGEEMAQAASQQISQAGNYWERCRSLYVVAQDHGRSRDALEALFAPGNQIKGRKAPWYRTYKSLLTACADRQIVINNETGMSEVQKLIKEAKQEEIENDPERKAEQDERMVEMFKRLAQGCLNRGIPKRLLADVLKEMEAQAAVPNAKDTGGGRRRRGSRTLAATV